MGNLFLRQEFLYNSFYSQVSGGTSYSTMGDSPGVGQFAAVQTYFLQYLVKTVSISLNLKKYVNFPWFIS